jgi:hypothetical protein
MIFLLFVVALGILTSQKRRYWGFAFAAVLLQNLTVFLLSGGGTLEDPRGDGYITAIVRAASNDGPIVVGVGVLAMVLGWGVPIYLVNKGFQRKSKAPDF